MSSADRDKIQAFEVLSAMADGEVDADGVDRACAAWRQDPEARARWHAYHQIGDVLRSEELGVGGGEADEVFMQKLRERLNQEPVVLAPAAVSPALVQDDQDGISAVARAPGVTLVKGRRRTWSAPAAVAAGFMAVAGLLVAVRQPDPSGALAGAQMAAVSAGPDVVASLGAADHVPLLASSAGALSSASIASSLVSPGDGVLHNAKLDAYWATQPEFSVIPPQAGGGAMQAVAEATGSR